MKRNQSLARTETFWGYVFLTPVIVSFLLFTALPTVMSLYYSFTNYDGVTPPKYIGWDNYANLFSNQEFGEALWNTLYFTLGTVPLGVFIALLVAVLLNMNFKGNAFFKTAYFIPVIVPYVAISMVWQWLYNDDYGLFNMVLGKMGAYQPPWLTSEEWAMPSVIIMSIWKNLGFNAVILLAGIQGIPRSLYEAAEIDGANGWTRFFKITLPVLRPVTIFVLITSMIGAFQAFDQIYVMTKGGPGTSTQVVTYLIYMNAFQYFKQGYASAMAYVLFVIIFVLSILQLKISEKGQEN